MLQVGLLVACIYRHEPSAAEHEDHVASCKAAVEGAKAEEERCADTLKSFEECRTTELFQLDRATLERALACAQAGCVLTPHDENDVQAAYVRLSVFEAGAIAAKDALVKPREVLAQAKASLAAAEIAACEAASRLADAPADSGSWVEETYVVLTEGKEQGAVVTAACFEMVIQDMVAKGKVIMGSTMKHLLTASDGCAAQFKCGTALAEKQALVQQGGIFHKKVQWQHMYGATSHFKGRHDSEGGAVKSQLRLWLAHQSVDIQDVGASIKRTAADCVAYGNEHLAYPSSHSDTSSAHRARAKVQRRTFLLAPPVPAKAVFAGVGIKDQHRVAFSEENGVRWSRVGCACLPCCTGRFSSCQQKAMVPELTKAILREKKEGGVGDAGGAVYC